MGRSKEKTEHLVVNNSDELGAAGSHVGQQYTERLIPGRTIYMAGDVTEQLVAQTIGALIVLANESKKDPITLMISTYGGSVDEMFALYDVIKHIECPVHTVGLGKIMSAGVLILASGMKGKRTIGNSARIMMHSLSGGAQGSVFDIKTQYNDIKKQQSLYENLMKRETNIPLVKLREMMKHGNDHYFSAQDAVRLGIVDSVFKPNVNK